MAKNILENEFNIGKEDEAIINKNDTSKKKKNFSGFTALEEIPDNEHYDPFNKEIDSPEDLITENQEEAVVDKNKNQEDIARLTKEIKFYQGEETASVGPDVGVEPIKEFEDEFKSVNVDPALTSKNIDKINPNHDETPEAKVEQMYDEAELREPTLNNRPLDKKFIDDENKAA